MWLPERCAQLFGESPDQTRNREEVSDRSNEGQRQPSKRQFPGWQFRVPAFHLIPRLPPSPVLAPKMAVKRLKRGLLRATSPPWS